MTLNEPTPRKPLRLWPGVVLVAVLSVLRFGVPLVVPDFWGAGVLAGLVGGLAVVVWWLFFSRAPWIERVGALVLMAAAVAATPLVLHESIATGMMGMMPVIYAIPLLSVALVVWAAVSRGVSAAPRYALLVAAIVLACGALTVVRTDGLKSDGSDLAWRWTPTAEEHLLVQAGSEPTAPKTTEPAAAKPEALNPAVPAAVVKTAAVEEAAADPAKPPAASAGDEPAMGTPIPAAAKMRAAWPGFRGPDRNGIVRGVRIETDWAKSPPVEVWRRAIGPGWSSFAVNGDVLYTQEQRGEEEVVAAYRLTTGAPVWRHRDNARFWESNGGAGPRGTPTLADGRVYAFGATGILNVLDAGSGAVVWSRNAASDAGKEVPYWGFASSPLVVDDVVIVAAAGQLVAYDRATGNRRWIGKAGGASYSSPHLLTIGGVTQVLLQSGGGAIGVAPADGTVLWDHAWPGSSTIVQPALISQGDLLVSANGDTGGIGMRRIAVSHGSGGWTAQERWTSIGLKPYFNDFVVHAGHAYGFDGSILACINLEDGTRAWKGGRYGNGQLVLLPDQDVLLVLSEDGELALVSATSDKFTEIARVPVLDGKTWNHPVLVGDLLLIRNDREMAAFRLSRASQ